MGPILFFIAVGIAFIYAYLLIYISDAWEDLPEWEVPQDFIPELQVSVIIPVRNESKFIRPLLKSILDNDYPSSLLEIIVVDDHSEDETVSEASFTERVKVVSLPANVMGKKAALSYGIQHCNGDLVICTDGDGLVGNQWISTISSYYACHQVDFTTALIDCSYKNRITDAFQYLDLAAMMQINAAGIARNTFYIANGANMAFRKSAYLKIGGLASHAHIASGDDMFLVQEMSEDPELRVRFLKSKSAKVTTKIEESLQAIFRQRKRWAAKTKHYFHRNLVKIQVFVFLVHVFILINFLLFPFTDGLSLFSGTFLLFLKWVMDYLFLAKMCRYYEDQRPLKYFIIAAALYFPLLIYQGFVAISAKSYDWKDRKITD